MGFRITGLDPAQFQALHALSDEALAGRGVQRLRIEQSGAAPCRVSLEDAAAGEHVLLLSYAHQTADTPYKQQGPIFVRAAAARYIGENETPPTFQRRTLSLRGFDADGAMLDADLCEGPESPALIDRLFANPDIAYIHAHYARRGCYAARIDRA